MQVITVSRAISIIEKRIKIAAYAMVAGWVLSMYIVIQLNVVLHWVFLGVALFNAVFLMVRSYLIVKWKIWAFEKVDNLSELIAKARDLRIIRSDIVPDKSTICSKADRQKIIGIIEQRRASETVANIADNHSLPPIFKIEEAKKTNLIIAIACFCIVYKPFERLFSETSNHPENDYGLVAVLLLAGFFFLFKTISPSVIVSLSNSGIWTKKSNFQKWKAIENIYIDYEINLKQERLTHLVIVFNSHSGMEQENFTQKFSIKNLNKNADEIEYALKIFKQRFEKSANFAIEYRITTKPKTKTDPKKNNPWVVLLFPIIIILIGCFMWFRTTRPKEEYYALKGKISYLGNSIGKHKNRDTKFLQIENNPNVFSIFVGQESGDFSPELDRTAELNVNDEVVLYYSSISTKQQFDGIPMNNSIQFIEKDRQLIFREGAKNKYTAYIILGSGSIFFMVVLVVIIRKKYFKLP